MKLIVGLGNPGKEFENNRHNLGFWVIDQLAQASKIELNRKKFNGLYYQTSEYILLKPQTYMNNSGECVVAFLNYFRIPLDNLLVIYDDIALPLGKFRYRQQGSAGGHNGMKNIIGMVGSKLFKRLRVGIGYERNFLIRDWVLKNFLPAEKEEIRKIVPNLIDSLQEWIEANNFERMMSRFNNK